MKNKKIEVLETNEFVRKHEGDIVRKNITFLEYWSMVDEETREEHERQMNRLGGSCLGYHPDCCVHVR